MNLLSNNKYLLKNMKKKNKIKENIKKENKVKI